MDARHNKGRSGITRYAQECQEEGWRRRQVRTFERCDTHDRTVFRGAQPLRYLDPEPLDDVHERRLDDVRLGPVKAATF